MTEVKKVRTRDEIPEESKWRVDKIYSGVELWEKDFEELKTLAPKLSSYSGKLECGRSLLEFLKLDEKVSRHAEKLAVFAHLKSDEDTSNTKNQSLKEKIFVYLPQVSSAEAFFTPELLSLPEGTIEREIKEVPELEMYRFMLDRILIMKPHTLSKEKEELLAAVSECLDAPENIYNMLSNADMTFPSIKDEEGNEVELSDVNYAKFIRSRDRRVRKEAFITLFNTYGKFKNTFAASLTSSMKNFIFGSKVRNFESALESALKPNNIPQKVFTNTIETINNNLEALHRYVRIKKKLLNLNEMHMYDLYVPVIEVPKEHIEFDEAVKTAEKALKPMGEEYLNIFRSGIDEGWIDVYENKGKRGGAYSSGAYDTMPYVLLNYNYELNDVSTLIHEMGHSIHSYYSRNNQPYVYGNYTIFCAEVASTCNESLLMTYLISKETDEKKKLFLVNEELEHIRTTVFRQTMFAEFEKITHETLEKGIPLTSTELSKIWHDLNVKYFGPDMIVDKEIDMEWSRIPHFYSDFYVYQYVTGYAAANSFAKTILNEGESAVERYKGFLKSGGSDYPINILKKAGVDMATPKPLTDTIERFNELLDIIEK